MDERIFVVFSDSFQELTFVRTGLLDDLIRNRGCRCLFIVPSERAGQRLRPHFDRASAEIVVYESRPASFWDRALRSLLVRKYERYAGPHRRARQTAALAEARPLLKIRNWTLGVLSSVIPERAILAVQNRVLSDRFIDGLFARHRPSLTLVSWGGAYEPCPMVIRSARKFGCRTISMDASWDCMDELVVVPKVDRLLVWNEAMKSEAIARHRYDPSRVSVIGPLRCDCYRKRGVQVDRSAFLEARGLLPDRKLIILAVNRGDPEIYVRIVNALLDADRTKSLAHPIQVCVRLAPWSDPESYQVLKRNPLVRVESSYDFKTDVMVRDEDIGNTVNLLRHADILISVLSTLILESAYFDTPNISLRFPEFAALYERDFLAPLYETGGVRFADDLPSLREEVNRYLLDPARDAGGRQAVLQRLCHGGDGLATARALREIRDLLGS